VITKEMIQNEPWFSASRYLEGSAYFQTPRGKLHYYDSHNVNPGLSGLKNTPSYPTLFLHGTPGWGYEWRHFLDQSLGRLIIPDHLGFGLSDRPDSYVSLTEHVKHLELLLKNLGISEINLVVHDFGGPIGIKLSLENPNLVKRLVIVNSWYWPFQDAVKFFGLQRIFFESSLMRFLYRHLGFSARVLTKAAWGKAIPLSKEEHHGFQRMQPRNQREGTLSFLRSLTDSDSFYGDYQKDLKSLSQIPILLIWGKADGVLKEAHLAKWQSILGDLPAVILSRAGHWPHLEEKETVTHTISEFLLDQ
jgi:haloalkane dehalogenase